MKRFYDQFLSPAILGNVTLDLDIRKISAAASVLSILCYFATLASLTIISLRRHAKIL